MKDAYDKFYDAIGYIILIDYLLHTSSYKLQP